MSEESRPIALNANQRRHFEVLFSRLEDSLSKIERLLNAPGSPSLLTIVQDDVPAAFRAHAESELPRIRDQIEEMASRLALQPRTVSLRRVIAAALTSDVVNIEDSASTQLRGYGSVDPSVVELLDPALSALAHSLSGLARGLTRRLEG
jgi:hypothetical protein